APGRQLGGAGQQPAAQGVEARAVRGCGPTAQNRAEAHVEIRRVPDQQNARGCDGRLGVAWFDVDTNVFGDTHALCPPRVRVDCFSHSNSATGLPASRAFDSYFVTGRRTEIGSGASGVVRRSRGSASATAAICSA